MSRIISSDSVRWLTKSHVASRNEHLARQHKRKWSVLQRLLCSYRQFCHSHICPKTTRTLPKHRPRHQVQRDLDRSDTLDASNGRAPHNPSLVLGVGEVLPRGVVLRVPSSLVHRSCLEVMACRTKCIVSRNSRSNCCPDCAGRYMLGPEQNQPCHAVCCQNPIENANPIRSHPAAASAAKASTARCASTSFRAASKALP